MILIISILPLALPPDESFVSNRLTAYATGAVYHVHGLLLALANCYPCSMCRRVPFRLQNGRHWEKWRGCSPSHSKHHGSLRPFRACDCLVGVLALDHVLQAKEDLG